MKEYRNLIIVASFVFLLIGIFFGFLLGLGSCVRQPSDAGHSLCAKAIELKAEEADSLTLELTRIKDDLRQCEDLYRELNNQKN